MLLRIRLSGVAATFFYTRLISYLAKFNLFYFNSMAFSQIAEAKLCFPSYKKKAIDKDLLVRSVGIDLTKAFDINIDQILVHKLQAYLSRAVQQIVSKSTRSINQGVSSRLDPCPAAFCDHCPLNHARRLHEYFYLR